MTGAILKHKISMFRYMFNGDVHLSTSIKWPENVVPRDLRTGTRCKLHAMWQE